MSFDLVAPWYRTLERIAFGEDLQRCRVACLAEIATPRHALVVGEGNGRFLCELLRLYPEVEVDCLDASERMLRLARERVACELPDCTKQVRFLHEDIMLWTASEQRYDLVVTHFCLDCFAEEQLGEVVKKLAGVAADEANWLLADFCVPDEGMARIRARAWLTAMYVFFRVTARIPAKTLVDPTPFLRAEGFALAQQHLFRKGMLKSQIWRRNR